MISANLLARRLRRGSTQDSGVHWKPKGCTLSIIRGRTQNISIKARVYRLSSARIQQISHIGACQSDGAPNYRDKLSGAPTIPVSRRVEP